jgi:hypothetical protein
MVGLSVAIVAGASVACRDEARATIRIEGKLLTVENLTADEWLNVEIWLNNHYRVTKARMPAGERLGVPLDVFVAGFGQRFSPARQVVQGIEVTATTTRGTPVKVVWGSGRKK